MGGKILPLLPGYPVHPDNGPLPNNSNIQEDTMGWICSSDVVRILKRRRLRWAGYLARIDFT